MRPMTIHLVAGARPNLMKVAPLYRRLRQDPRFQVSFVYSGQHYDPELSTSVMSDLELPVPDFELGVGSGTHAEQTANVMVRYEKVLVETRPDLVVVVGDVNSTLAAALAAKKLGIKVAHLEAGLRSFDGSMPEEINRVATDAISDYFWTPSLDANENLLREGVPNRSIAFVGNSMIETFLNLEEKIIADNSFSKLEDKRKMIVATFHRPANVDKKTNLEKLVGVLTTLASDYHVVFPVHPRTKKRLVDFGLYEILSKSKGITLLAPLSYVPFMSLIRRAAMVVTDSGGIQEETSFLGIPCYTLRPNTERPITVSEGTNRLVTLESVLKEIKSSGAISKSKGALKFWDADVSLRITEELVKIGKETSIL